jgi:hypothetical protein
LSSPAARRLRRPAVCREPETGPCPGDASTLPAHRLAPPGFPIFRFARPHSLRTSLAVGFGIGEGLDPHLEHEGHFPGDVLLGETTGPMRRHPALRLSVMAKLGPSSRILIRCSLPAGSMPMATQYKLRCPRSGLSTTVPASVAPGGAPNARSLLVSREFPAIRPPQAVFALRDRT